MKKFGFTLAEVLITLGIVGVVAALTAPALVQNAGSAQVGPKLAKAVNTFEVANENMLNDTGAATVVASGATSGSYASPAVNYIDNLSNYMKINYTDESNVSSKYVDLIKDYNGADISDIISQKVNVGKFNFISLSYNSIKIADAAKKIGLSKEGMIYGISLEQEFLDDIRQQQANGRQDLVIRQANLITGSTAHKKQIGTLIVDINGYAKPNRLGKDLFAFALMADGSLTPVGQGGAWNNGNSLCNETTVTRGETCTASIFENNLKVIYQ